MCYYILEIPLNMLEHVWGDCIVLAGPYEKAKEADYWLESTIAKLQEERLYGEIIIREYPDDTDLRPYFCPVHLCSGRCREENCSWKSR